ncbi:hypothetical protein CK203_108252 [Vitis vinifera]|uniref:Uncharacterized protein n=1 Tax=Vitis vinifera TaxID=29760 RepID=A0A438D003_VITVI|nr:hypothetical protein CK203_108252 [Vitis vinifera]
MRLRALPRPTPPFFLLISSSLSPSLIAHNLSLLLPIFSHIPPSLTTPVDIGQSPMLIPCAPSVPRSCQVDGCATSTKIGGGTWAMTGYCEFLTVICCVLTVFVLRFATLALLLHSGFRCPPVFFVGWGFLVGVESRIFGNGYIGGARFLIQLLEEAGAENQSQPSDNPDRLALVLVKGPSSKRPRSARNLRSGLIGRLQDRQQEIEVSCSSAYDAHPEGAK